MHEPRSTAPITQCLATQERTPAMTRLAAPIAAVVVLGAIPQARAKEGADVFQQKCASCHGSDGAGTALGKKLGAKDLKSTKLPRTEIEKVIADGRGKMPAFRGKLSHEEVAALSAYIANGLK